MKTEQLIRCLTADLPTQPRSVGNAIALSLGVSLAASLAAMILWLSPRPEMAAAMLSPAFWVKAAYTSSVGTAGLLAVERLGRPDGEARVLLYAIAVVIGGLAGGALLELVLAPAGTRSQLLFGNSSGVCTWRIVVLSTPILVGAYLLLRHLAPTRFALTGAAAGLMAGGYGACIYSLACAEHSLVFLATWYTLGILAMGLLGALCSKILRW